MLKHVEVSQQGFHAQLLEETPILSLVKKYRTFLYSMKAECL